MLVKQCFTNVSSFLKAKVNLLALLFCGLSGGFWMIVLAERYYYFIYNTAWHSAYYAQNLWGILHGDLSPSIQGSNFIVNHCSFLCFIFAPLYVLFPDPVILQYLKVWGFFGGAYIFFLVLKKHLHPLIALAAMIVFTVAPANVSDLFYMFSYETFAIPLVFLIYKAFDDKNYCLYIVCCFLLAMVKEQMPLVVMMFGIFALLLRKENRIKWAMVPLLMGLFIFIVEVFILTPYVRRDLHMTQSYFWERYYHFGRDPQQILFFLLTHPARVLAQFVTPANIKWYNDLFGVWGGLAFLSPHVLIPAIPLFLKSILSSDNNEHLVTWAFYASTFTPFIFLATWMTLNQIKNEWRLRAHCLAIAMMLVHALTFAPKWLPMFKTPITANALAKQRFIDQIPPGASCLSAWTTLAPLANRNNLYPVRTYLKGAYYQTWRKFKLPAPVPDYLLLDFEQEWWHNLNEYIPQTTFNFDDRWRLRESIEDVALYVRNSPPKKVDRLIEKSLQPFLRNVSQAPVRFEDTVSLEGMEYPKEFPKKYRIFPVTLYWKGLQKTVVSYEIEFRLLSNGKTYYVKQRPIGTMIYPTKFWQGQEYVREKYFYLFPRLEAGEYLIKMRLYDPKTRQWSSAIEQKFFVS